MRESIIQTLIEPVPVFDEFYSGLERVEDAGCCARFVLYSDQTLYETGDPIRVLRRKILLPYDAILPGIELTLGFLGRRIVASAGNVVRLRR